MVSTLPRVAIESFPEIGNQLWGSYDFEYMSGAPQLWKSHTIFIICIASVMGMLYKCFHNCFLTRMICKGIPLCDLRFTPQMLCVSGLLYKDPLLIHVHIYIYIYHKNILYRYTYTYDPI